MDPVSSDIVSSAPRASLAARLDIWFGALSMVGLMAAMLFIAEGTVAWVAASFFGLAALGWLVFAALGVPTLAWLARVLRNAVAAEREMALGPQPHSDPGASAANIADR